MTRCTPLLLPLVLLLAGLDCGSHAANSDMAAAGDMARKVDLGPPVLTNLPACAPAMVTGAALFTGVVKPQCSTAKECHGNDSSSVYYSLGSASDMVNKWVGVPSTEVSMNRVTAKMPNQSYVMFRLLGEGGAVEPPLGVSNVMPSGGSRLPDADLCMFLNWIDSGATM